MQNVGQVSDDGRWRWDGAQWAPVSTALAQPVQYPPSVFVQAAPTNGLAVASLVFGILSWVLCPLAGGVIAVACGHLAKSQIKSSGESGGGMATAGMILGYVHLAFWGIGLLFLVFVLGGLGPPGAFAGPHSHYLLTRTPFWA